MCGHETGHVWTVHCVCIYELHMRVSCACVSSVLDAHVLVVHVSCARTWVDPLFSDKEFLKAKHAVCSWVLHNPLYTHTHPCAVWILMCGWDARLYMRIWDICWNMSWCRKTFNFYWVVNRYKVVTVYIVMKYIPWTLTMWNHYITSICLFSLNHHFLKNFSGFPDLFI